VLRAKLNQNRWKQRKKLVLLSPCPEKSKTILKRMRERKALILTSSEIKQKFI
jgi:hypothetical protein